MHLSQAHACIPNLGCVLHLSRSMPMQVLNVLVEETRRPEMHMAVISTLAVRACAVLCCVLAVPSVAAGGAPQCGWRSTPVCSRAPARQPPLSHLTETMCML